jgi:two-component system sensor histidine kinase UhpB
VIGQPAAPTATPGDAAVGPADSAVPEYPEYLTGPPLYWRLLAANLFVVLGGAVIGTAVTRQFVLSGSFTLVTAALMVVVAMTLSAVLTGIILHIAFRPLRDLRQAIERSPAPGQVTPTGGLRPTAPDRYGDPDILAVSRAVRGLWDSLDQHVRLLEDSNRRLEEQRRELADKTVQLQRLAGLVLAAQEDERRRVARELHDETMQSMAALLMGLEGILQALPEGNEGPRVAAARQSISRLRDLAARMLDEMRNLALDLRPSVLDDHGLVAAVRWLALTLKERTGLRCRVSVGGDLARPVDGAEGAPAGADSDLAAARRLPPTTETALFRITQEALANVAKHAEAANVSVRLVQTATAVSVEISDDGVGLPVSPEGPPTLPGHMGLFNMRERAALLGGTCTIRRRGATGGTVVRAELPLPATQPAFTPALPPATATATATAPYQVARDDREDGDRAAADDPGTSPAPATATSGRRER